MYIHSCKMCREEIFLLTRTMLQMSYLIRFKQYRWTLILKFYLITTLYTVKNVLNIFLSVWNLKGLDHDFFFTILAVFINGKVPDEPWDLVSHHGGISIFFGDFVVIFVKLVLISGGMYLHSWNMILRWPLFGTKNVQYFISWY